MLLASKIIIGVVCLLHIYIFLLETVLFKTRGAKVFGIPAHMVEPMRVPMSNQGCYNGFLALALGLGLFWPNPVVAQAFAVFGLVCVAIAGVWGAVTALFRILYIQTVPAVLGLLAMYFA
jgi:putative membrane protein